MDSLDVQRQNTPPDIQKKSNLVLIVLCHYCLLYIVLQASVSSCRKSVQLQVLHTYKVEVAFMISFSATNFPIHLRDCIFLEVKSFKFDSLGHWCNEKTRGERINSYPSFLIDCLEEKRGERISSSNSIQLKKIVKLSSGYIFTLLMSNHFFFKSSFKLIFLDIFELFWCNYFKNKF